ncbi:MAG: molybdopterin-dependent oxidoreductase [Hyphomicrobium sp.]|nr:molybdopterin-dependent oxidoreductase [Hyphomicrobium sp.]
MDVPVSANRRQFLQGSAALGLVVGFHLPLVGRARAAEPAGEFVPNAFIRIAPDDTVTVLSKHIEFGQGPYTGIATILADELDADWAQMRVESAPADAKNTPTARSASRVRAARPPWPTLGTSSAPPAPRHARVSSRRRRSSGASMPARSPSRRAL